MELLRLTTDFVFKLVFTTSPDLLIDLINSILSRDPNPPQAPIVQIEILNPELTKESETGKMSILDIKAMDEKDNLYNIEMQAFPHTAFVKRALYYWAKLYGSQLKEGDDYRKLRPTYSINFLNYSLINTQECHSIFTLIEKNQNLQLTEDISIHFIELPKFIKNLANINDNFELWLYTIKESNHLEESDMRIIIDKNPAMKETFSVLSHISADDKIRMQEEHRRMELSQYNTDMNASYEKGIITEKKENAQRMKEEGLANDLISRITGLAIEEIEKL